MAVDAGGLWQPDGQALGGGHVDDPFDRVVLCGCLRGGGWCFGEVGGGYGGRGVPVAWAFLLLLLSPLL